MRAVEKLFTGGRFHEVTLDEVAREAGVGKGTLYRYFQDKEDLFFETAHSGFDSLCELLKSKVPDGADFPEQLLEACLQIGSFFQQRRHLLEMMQSEEGRASLATRKLRLRWMEKRKMLVEAISGIIRKGIQEKRVRSDIEPEVQASFLLGLLRTRARDLQEADERMRRYEVVIDIFCNGVSYQKPNETDSPGVASESKGAPEPSLERLKPQA